jgi:hypothetical protein
MILADPPALHLLAAEAVAQLHACVTTYKVPSENEALLFVLRLMYLAVGSKKMLRDVSGVAWGPKGRAVIAFFLVEGGACVRVCVGRQGASDWFCRGRGHWPSGAAAPTPPPPPRPPHHPHHQTHAPWCV